MPNYLDNDDLVRELRNSRALGAPTAELANMFNLIASRVSRKFTYDNYMDREDCISTAVEIMLKKYDKFDFGLQTNAFSYYTQIALNGLYYGWNQIAKNRSCTYSIDRIFQEPI